MTGQTWFLFGLHMGPTSGQREGTRLDLFWTRTGAAAGPVLRLKEEPQMVLEVAPQVLGMRITWVNKIVS